MKEKNEVVRKIAQNAEDQVRLAQALDKLETCRIRGYATQTRFLDLRERNLIIQMAKEMRASSEMVLMGGYPEAERVVAVFYPDYMTSEDAIDSAELAVLRVEKNQADALTHRDYLGALMGLQVRRECIGDILVHDEGADIIVLEEIAAFLLLHLDRVGKRRVQLTRVQPNALKMATVSEEIREGNVASLRLDCVVAELFEVSRAQAQEAISKGLLFVNQMTCLKGEKVLGEGDSLTFRGKGRARVNELLGVSRKGRQFLQYTRFK